MSTEIVKAGGSLAIRPDQTMWSPQQEAVLRQSGISDSVTKAELAGFLHLCQRTGLDPFSRQIYLIGRWNKKAGREVFTPQTAIDGYRVISHRAAAEAACTLGYEDTLWCDASGTWRDVWLEDKPPAAAKVTVLRNGQRFSAVARYSEYVQTFPSGDPSGLWAKMPAGQTAKCAEALALRKAFPHDLAGVYTDEEMAQAENATPAPHLRAVSAGETDQWQQATPAAVIREGVADVPPESLTPAGRDYLHEALAAPDAATVRLIWQDAKAEGARDGYLAQIADVGKQKAGAAQSSSSPAQQLADEAARATLLGHLRDFSDRVGQLRSEPVNTPNGRMPLIDYISIRTREVAAADAEQQMGPTRVVTGQVMSAQEQAEAAERELRQFAEQVGLPEIAADFEGAKGLPLSEATAGQIGGFLTELRGSAA